MDIDRNTRLFILSAVGISISVWNMAFTLGAYETIFYDRLLLLWVVSMAVLLACVILPREQRPITRGGLLIMSLPTVWVILSVAQQWRGDFTFIDNLIFYTISAILGIAFPYIVWVLLSVTQTETLTLLPKKLLYGLIVIAIVIGIAGFTFGVNNNLLLECEDFRVAGDSLPENCWNPPENSQE